MAMVDGETVPAALLRRQEDVSELTGALESLTCGWSMMDSPMLDATMQERLAVLSDRWSLIERGDAVQERMEPEDGRFPADGDAEARLAEALRSTAGLPRVRNERVSATLARTAQAYRLLSFMEDRVFDPHRAHPGTLTFAQRLARLGGEAGDRTAGSALMADLSALCRMQRAPVGRSLGFSMEATQAAKRIDPHAMYLLPSPEQEDPSCYRASRDPSRVAALVTYLEGVLTPPVRHVSSPMSERLEALSQSPVPALADAGVDWIEPGDGRTGVNPLAWDGEAASYALMAACMSTMPADAYPGRPRFVDALERSARAYRCVEGMETMAGTRARTDLPFADRVMAVADSCPSTALLKYPAGFSFLVDGLEQATGSVRVASASPSDPSARLVRLADGFEPAWKSPDPLLVETDSPWEGTAAMDPARATPGTPGTPMPDASGTLPPMTDEPAL